MRRGLIAATLVLAAAVFGTVMASAEEGAPVGGDAFGQHVASMAPEHARMHGAMFGQCVAAMARTGGCPHMP